MGIWIISDTTNGLKRITWRMRCAISCDLLPPWSCDRISLKLQLTGKSRLIFQFSRGRATSAHPFFAWRRFKGSSHRKNAEGQWNVNIADNERNLPGLLLFSLDILKKCHLTVSVVAQYWLETFLAPRLELCLTRHCWDNFHWRAVGELLKNVSGLLLFPLWSSVLKTKPPYRR